MKITGNALELAEFMDCLTSRQRVTEEIAELMFRQDDAAKTAVGEATIIQRLDQPASRGAE
jgi:hypothetical protein